LTRVERVGGAAQRRGALRERRVHPGVEAGVQAGHRRIDGGRCRFGHRGEGGRGQCAVERRALGEAGQIDTGRVGAAGLAVPAVQRDRCGDADLCRGHQR
jgi:hypothetical protein